MIKIRLKRYGRKQRPAYRIVAMDSRVKRDGKAIEELGFYNPRTKETRLDTEALRIRLGQGAQPTDAVRTLLEKGGLLEKKVRPAELVGKQKQENHTIRFAFARDCLADEDKRRLLFSSQ